MARLIHDNDLLTTATNVFQAESSKNRADIQWIRQYLGQEEAAELLPLRLLQPIPQRTLPRSSLPRLNLIPLKTEYFSSDGDNHDDLSDME
ncbi:hypothetical protein CJ030_MR2G019471 [Morella rubra]|uniref:Uncharacterized protein n=1 Tax=Morella rubra TaxID=262757 RepID=A0A6A1WCD0_9ROSI|nr:hypothetical protein CJ030_MR2G019471 [Morella rubra]